MGCDYGKCARRYLGVKRTQSCCTAQSRPLVVYRVHSTQCFHSSNSWRDYGQSRQDRVSAVSCVLRLCCNYRDRNHLLIPRSVEESRVFVVRIWWPIFNGSLNPRNARRPSRLNSSWLCLPNRLSGVHIALIED